MKHHYGDFSLSTSIFIRIFYLTSAQKRKFSIKNYSSKCAQIPSLQRIWSHLLEKSLMENFCAVQVPS